MPPSVRPGRCRAQASPDRFRTTRPRTRCRRRARPGWPRSRTNWSQFVASRSVAVVMTPPRGPASSRSLRSRPAVRPTSVGRSGSMIGTVRRLRPLVRLVTRAPRPGYVCRNTWSRPRPRSTSPTRRPETSLIRSAVVARRVTGHLGGGQHGRGEDGHGLLPASGGGGGRSGRRGGGSVGGLLGLAKLTTSARPGRGGRRSPRSRAGEPCRGSSRAAGQPWRPRAGRRRAASWRRWGSRAAPVSRFPRAGVVTTTPAEPAQRGPRSLPA